MGAVTAFVIIRNSSRSPEKLAGGVPGSIQALTDSLVPRQHLEAIGLKRRSPADVRAGERQ